MQKQVCNPGYMDPILIQKFWLWKINRLGGELLKPTISYKQYEENLSVLQQNLQELRVPEKQTGDLEDWFYWMTVEAPCTSLSLRK